LRHRRLSARLRQELRLRHQEQGLRPDHHVPGQQHQELRQLQERELRHDPQREHRHQGRRDRQERHHDRRQRRRCLS